MRLAADVTEHVVGGGERDIAAPRSPARRSPRGGRTTAENSTLRWM
jgi:hypothetical protein